MDKDLIIIDKNKNREKSIASTHIDKLIPYNFCNAFGMFYQNGFNIIEAEQYITSKGKIATETTIEFKDGFIGNWSEKKMRVVKSESDDPDTLIALRACVLRYAYNPKIFYNIERIYRDLCKAHCYQLKIYYGEGDWCPDSVHLTFEHDGYNQKDPINRTSFYLSMYEAIIKHLCDSKETFEKLMYNLDYFAWEINNTKYGTPVKTNRIFSYSDVPYEHVETKDRKVDHPNHYQSYGMEVIDVIDCFCEDCKGSEAFYVGNILKYVCRFKKKNGVEDLKKARWYLNRLIDDLDSLPERLPV